jgi:hypothetical protein
MATPDQLAIVEDWMLARVREHCGYAWMQPPESRP